MLPNDRSNGNSNAGQADKSLSQTQYYFYKQNLWDKDYKDVLDYIKSRGFKEQTIKAYNLGAGTEEFYDEDGQSHKVQLVYFPIYKKKTFKNTRQEVIE